MEKAVIRIFRFSASEGGADYATIEAVLGGNFPKELIRRDYYGAHLAGWQIDHEEYVGEGYWDYYVYLLD